MTALIALALAAATCPPRAWLEGDPQVVAEVSAALVARGVVLDEGTAACPPVRARLAAVEGGVALQLRDGAGRSAEHVVSQPALAAALLESWARPDLAGSLLVPPSLPAPSPAPVAAAAVADHPLWLSPSAQAEVSLAEDGAVAPGLRLSSALEGRRLAPFAAVRLAFAPRVEVPGLPLAQRRSADLLLGARLPLRLGSLRIAPGLAAGAGVLQTTRADDDCGATCQRPIVEDGASAVGVGLRGEASVSVALPLSGALAADLAASALVSPLAREGAELPGYTRPLSRRAGHLGLAPEPLWTLGLALGLRWGAP